MILATYVLILLMLFIGLYPIYKEYKVGTLDFFNFKNLFIIYFLIQFSGTGLFILIFGSSYFLGPSMAFEFEYYFLTILYATLGLLAFQLGYYLKIKILKINLNYFKVNWNGKRKKYLILFYFVLGYLGFYFLLQKNGGFQVFLENREKWRTEDIIGQGIFLFPATIIVNMASFMNFLNFKSYDNKSLGKITIIQFFAILPAFFLGFRAAMVLPILQFLVIYNYRVKKIQIKYLVPFVLILMLGFSFYGVYRYIPQGQNIDFEEVWEGMKENPDLMFSFLLRSRGVEVTASVIKKLSIDGEFKMVYPAIIETLTIPIPKIIWFDKPQPLGVQFTTYFFASDFEYQRGIAQAAWGGISPTIIGELYWHLGLFGVIFGMFFFGYFTKNIIRFVTINNKNDLVLLWYCFAFTNCSMFAEAIQGYINSLFMITIFIIVTNFIISVKFKYV
jgi:hypothetical protein